MKKIFLGISVCLFSLGLIAMQMGFLPSHSRLLQEWRSEINRDQSAALLPLASRDAALIPVHSGLVSIERNGPEILEGLLDEGITSSSPLAFLHLDGGTVSLLTESGPVPVPFSADLPAGEALNFSAALHNELLEPAFYSTLPGLGADLQAMPHSSQQDVAYASLLNLPALQKPLQPERPLPSLPTRVATYRQTIEKYATRYSLDVSLVMAIIQAESNFNPNLISSRNAHGLMQIVPEAAGNEVHRYLGRTETLSASLLLNPEDNIRYGITYLHLLRAFHLKGIEDPLSLEYCTIAAYNGGSGALLRYFGANNEEAVSNINSMTSQDLLTCLLSDFPLAETRNYLNKVLNSRGQYLLVASN